VPGPRDPRLTPYIVPIERVFVSGQASVIVLACGAQMGKSEAILDIAGERLDRKPVPILYVGPSQDFVRQQFEPRVKALVEGTAVLMEKMAPERKQSKTRKLIAGVPFRLAHGGSSTALKSDPAGIAFVDEFDEMMRNVRGQGDVGGLVTARGDTHADFVSMFTSTPSIGSVEVYSCPDTGLRFWKPADPEDIKSQIWRLWQTGTMFHWAWECPTCKEAFIPRFECLSIPKGVTPREAGRKARIICPKNGCVLEEKHKKKMNAGGMFIAPGGYMLNADGEIIGDNVPDNSVWSFWVSGICSPFVTLAERVERLMRAEAERDPDKIQTAKNAGFGELDATGGGDALRPEEVQARRTAYAGDDMPPDAVKLTLAVDVQADRLIYGFRAWGYGETSWRGPFGEIFGDTAQVAVWQELTEMMREPVSNMRPERVFIDSGFRPGDPKRVDVNRVYEFCRTRAPLVYATKGSSSKLAAPLIKSEIEVTPRGEKARYGLAIVRLDTDHWKQQVFNLVRRDVEEAGAWFIPDDADDDYCMQVASESRKVTPNGKPEWKRLRRANHALDIEAMNCAAAHMIGAHRIPKGKQRAKPMTAAERSITPARTQLTGFARLAQLNNRGLK
jgi:phage terminase large subunit GpA-like protein